MADNSRRTPVTERMFVRRFVLYFCPISFRSKPHRHNGKPARPPFGAGFSQPPASD